MADFTKAGLDRGNIEQELKNTLTSIKMLIRACKATIEDLTPEEIEFDLKQYELLYEREISPLLKRAKEDERKIVSQLSEELQSSFEMLIGILKDGIEKRNSS
ncbi:MAG: hypothetical protein NZL90_03610 [Aquificaceae bacterium]|nr:hypothetical protein [Aquificaceae bacterium]MDW8237105.1 hypothetical protein [Aquificaceae bacterium]